MLKTNRFLKTALVFFAGNMLSKLVSFLLLPLYTSKINPIQFGNYDIASSIINLIVPIAFFQIWDAMYRYAFDYSENKEKQGVISNSVAVCFFGLIIYISLFSLLQIFLKLDYFEYVLIYGVLYAVHYLHNYSARLYLLNVLFVVSGVMCTLVTAITNIVLILGLNLDIKSIYLSSIIGMAVQILIIEFKIGVFRNFKFKEINKTLIKKMLRFSIPLCISTVSFWLLSGLTRIFIQYLDGEYANGLFAVANKFGSLVILIVSIIQFAWNEMAYIYSGDDYEGRIKKYSISVNVLTIGVIYCTALLCLAIKVVFPIFINAQYNDALLLIPATIIGVAGNSLASFVATIFMAEKNNGFIMISTFISACINVVGGYFATKYWGAQGAIILLGICFVLLYLLRVIKLRKLYKFKIDILNYLLATLVLIVSIFLFFKVESIWFLILICFAILLIMSLSFYKYILLSIKKKDKDNN